MLWRGRVLTAITLLCTTAAAFAREWSDVSGKFRVEAELVAVKNGKVFLEKNDGSVLSVPLDRLSDADRQYLNSQPEGQDKSKIANPGVSDTTNGNADGAAGAAEVSTPQELAKRAHAVFEANCYRCHGQDGATEGGFNYILNLEKLTKTHVKPNDPSGSLLYQRISSHDSDMQMPPAGEKPRPQLPDIAIVRKWIEAGAPALPDENPRAFISNDQVFKSILADLRATPERARKYNRYFTLTHLYNAGFSDDELQTYRNAFLKLINSLSWNADLVTPEAIDPARTVLRIDLRQLNWTDEIWNEIANRNPYGLKYASADARACYKESGSEMPMVRVDWFVFAASRPPLYHSILELPASDAELERMLHVNVPADIRQEQVIRAAFNHSGISRNNRLIERHRLSTGSYWKSYDFRSNTGHQNLFEFPMGPGDAEDSFHQDGGEIIFSLPNGLQGYMLVNGSGQRIDKGPTDIVSDVSRSDRAVLNGLSCMSCHYAGTIPKVDEIRPFVEANRKAFHDPDSVLVLYPKQQTLDHSYADDSQRFTAALQKLGIKKISRTGEPVSTMALRFEDELGPRLAAAEFGLTSADFEKQLAHCDDTVARCLGVLRTPGGTVKRDAFVEVFVKAAVQLRIVPENAATVASIQSLTSDTNTAHGQPVAGRSEGRQVGFKDFAEVQRFSKMGWGVSSLAFSPDAKWLAVGKSDRSVELYDVTNGSKLSFLEKLESLGQITCLAFTPDGKKLLGGGSSGGIAIWDISAEGQLARSGLFAGHTQDILSIEISPDGRFVLSGGKDKCTRYWQLDTGREVLQPLEFSREVRACRILPGGNRAVASDGETVSQFDLTSGKILRTFKVHHGWGDAMAFSPSGDKMISGDGPKLQMWNLQTGMEMPCKMEDHDTQSSVRFSPDGKLLFTGNRGKVNVWDWRSQQKIAALELAADADVKTMACSPDGSLLAAIPSRPNQDLQVFRCPRP